MAQDSSAGTFDDFTVKNDFIEGSVSLVEVIDQIEFTDIAKVAVEDFHKEVDCLQTRQFRVVEIDAHNEEKTDVSAVNKLVIAVLHKVGIAVVAGVQKAINIDCELLLLFVSVGNIPLGKSGLSNTVLN